VAEGSSISVLDKIIAQLKAEGIDTANVTRDTTFEQLGMDSLDFISFITALDVEIPKLELVDISTVGQLADLLEKHAYVSG
jgi:acyl carrier protein